MPFSRFTFGRFAFQVFPLNPLTCERLAFSCLTFVGFALGSGLASAATGDPPLTGVIGWSAAVVGALLITWLSYAFYAVAVVMVMTSVGFGLGAAIASFFNAPAWVDVVVGLAGAVLLVVLALATNLPEIHRQEISFC